MEEFESAADQKETVIDSFGIHEKPANVSGIVNSCGLCTGRGGNVEQLENGAELVIDVSKIGAGAVCLCAVVTGSLSEVVLAEELIEWRAGIVHFQEMTSLICETVGIACGVNVKAGGLGIVIDGDDLGLGRTREVLVGKGLAGQDECEAPVDGRSVVARDPVGIVDAEPLGKHIAGELNGFEVVGRRLLGIHGHTDKNSQIESERQCVDSFHLSPVTLFLEFGLLFRGSYIKTRLARSYSRSKKRKTPRALIGFTFFSPVI